MTKLDKTKDCCGECFSPSQDVNFGKGLTAVPESCLDEECSCHREEVELKKCCGSCETCGCEVCINNPVYHQPQPNNNIDNLIRDITRVGFMPKGEARRRIEGMLTQTKKTTLENCIESLNMLILKHGESLLQMSSEERAKLIYSSSD